MIQDPKQFFRSRATLLTPGPTPVPAAVRQVGLKEPVYHRGPEFKEIFLRCRKRLAELFQSSAHPMILTSSGTGALEAALVNFTAEGDEVIVVKAGKFGERWQKLAESYRCSTTIIDIEQGSAVQAEQIIDELKKRPNTKALFIQASETSTGVFHPIETISKRIKQDFPDVLVVVDAVSAICAHDLKMSNWGIDVMASGSQKGFGVPPGLAFIAVADSTWQRLSNRSRFYFDLEREKKGQDEGLSAWTSATTLIEQLDVALEALCEMGPTKLASHHKRLSDTCRNSMTAAGIELFAKDSPSHALTSFLPPYGISASDLSNHLKSRYGFQIAGGQGNLKGVILRLSHLGFVDDFSVLESLNALEFSLKDLHHAHNLGRLMQPALELLHSSSEA